MNNYVFELAKINYLNILLPHINIDLSRLNYKLEAIMPQTYIKKLLYSFNQ